MRAYCFDGECRDGMSGEYGPPFELQHTKHYVYQRASLNNMPLLDGPVRRYSRGLARRLNARLRPYRFLIYASARSGSTSLTKALNCYAGIECASEPFNPEFYKNLRDEVTDLPSLQREIARLWRHYNGFKHVWEYRGWPFDQPLFNDYIVSSAAATVILLHRRNLLQRIVSDDISHQSNVWHIDRGEERAKLLDHPFEPLDRASVRQRLEVERQAFTDVQRRLEEVRVPYKVVSYEQLFGARSEGEKLSVLGEMISFITKAPFKPKKLGSEALAIMDPAEKRLNSSKTYELIPLIHEVEDEFGCDETGYLFR